MVNSTVLSQSYVKYIYFATVGRILSPNDQSMACTNRLICQCIVLVLVAAVVNCY